MKRKKGWRRSELCGRSVSISLRLLKKNASWNPLVSPIRLFLFWYILRAAESVNTFISYYNYSVLLYVLYIYNCLFLFGIVAFFKIYCSLLFVFYFFLCV